MPTMNNMSEIMEEVAKLSKRDQGWQFVPCHDPERASFGMMATRRVRPDGTHLAVGQVDPNEKEEMITYEWLPYGKRLEPEIRVAESLQQFRMMVNDLRPRGIFRCDAPKELKVGFVSYDGEKAHIVRCPLTKLKQDVLEGADLALAMEIQIGLALKML